MYAIACVICYYTYIHVTLTIPRIIRPHPLHIINTNYFLYTARMKKKYEYVCPSNS